MSSAKYMQNTEMQQSETVKKDRFVDIPGSVSPQPVAPVYSLMQHPTFMSNNQQGFPVDPNWLDILTDPLMGKTSDFRSLMGYVR